MLIGMKQNWRRVIKRRVITGNLLHCLRAADSVTYVEYAPSSAPSAASHLTRSDAPPRGLVRFLARQIG